MAANSPFFVIGNPRSGTTLLRLMLNSHPTITVPPECGFALWLHEKYAHSDYADPDVVEAYIKDVVASKKFETWKLDEQELRKYLRPGTYHHYCEMATDVYRCYGESQGKESDFVGDKNNYYIGQLEELKSAFPHAKYIIIVRDGRDVACSYKKLTNETITSKYKPVLPVNIEDIANEWASNNRQAMLALKDQSITIKYEDILQTPADTLGSICNYLGVEYSNLMLAYPDKNDEPTEFMQWKQKTMELPDVRNMGKYKTELTTSEIDLFEKVAQDMLAQFNYL